MTSIAEYVVFQGRKIEEREMGKKEYILLATQTTILSPLGHETFFLCSKKTSQTSVKFIGLNSFIWRIKRYSKHTIMYVLIAHTTCVVLANSILVYTMLVLCSSIV